MRDCVEVPHCQTEQFVPVTQLSSFVWKRKNVTLTGHGAMVRLDGTVKTLRWYMFLIWLYKGGELTN